MKACFKVPRPPILFPHSPEQTSRAPKLLRAAVTLVPRAEAHAKTVLGSVRGPPQLPAPPRMASHVSCSKSTKTRVDMKATQAGPSSQQADLLGVENVELANDSANDWVWKKWN